MFVKFVADGSVEEEGFNATFSKGTIKGLIFSCRAKPALALGTTFVRVLPLAQESIKDNN